MGLKDLFSNLTQTFELLISMAPIIDQKLLVLFAGLILGYLEMAGYANPADHAHNIDELTQVLGAFITAITIISYFVHNAVTEKNKMKYGSPAQPVSSQTYPQLIQKIKSFVLASESTNNQQIGGGVQNG